MSQPVVPPQPYWVRMSLWGVPDRRAAIAMYWVCIAMAIVFPVYMAETRQHLPGWWLWGGCLGFMTFSYLAAVNVGRAIRWRDRYNWWTQGTF
jgi:hypothetical protein